MDLFRSLVQLMLPQGLLDYFEVVDIRETSTLIEISLDELYYEAYKANADIESKGFMLLITITDFPIQDHKLLFSTRRRCYLNRKERKSFSRPIDLAAEGMC